MGLVLVSLPNQRTNRRGASTGLTRIAKATPDTVGCDSVQARHTTRFGGIMSEFGSEGQQSQQPHGQQGQRPYPSQPGAGGNLNVPGGQPSGQQAKGFFGALFDVSFQTFITPKLVKFVYILIMVLVAVSYVGYVLTAFQVSFLLGLFVMFILGPLVAILILALYRVALEFFLAVIRMSEDIHHRLPSGPRS